MPQYRQTPSAPCADFRRKFVTRRLVAVCFVLGRRNWNSATLVVLDQHLAVTHPIQTLRHAIPPVCSALQRSKTWQESERWHCRREMRSDKPCGGRDRCNFWLPEPQERSASISSRGSSRTPGGASHVSGRLSQPHDPGDRSNRGRQRKHRRPRLRRSRDARRDACRTLGDMQGDS